MKKPLVLISIDYSKAYGSIKRDVMIETLKKYKAHPKLIDVIADIMMVTKQW